MRKDLHHNVFCDPGHDMSLHASMVRRMPIIDQLGCAVLRVNRRDIFARICSWTRNLSGEPTIRTHFLRYLVSICITCVQLPSGPIAWRCVMLRHGSPTGRQRVMRCVLLWERSGALYAYRLKNAKRLNSKDAYTLTLEIGM